MKAESGCLFRSHQTIVGYGSGTAAGPLSNRQSTFFRMQLDIISNDYSFDHFLYR
jgi:hypothetical protein